MYGDMRAFVGGDERNRLWRYIMAYKHTKKTKRTAVEHTAFLMGLVDRGRSNPNSRISESYNNGRKKPESQKKKPLF